MCLIAEQPASGAQSNKTWIARCMASGAGWPGNEGRILVVGPSACLSQPAASVPKTYGIHGDCT